ncbi:secreted UDP-N-acetylglucosamine pyrophosphorylase-like protein [Cryptosporidium canis]|uniref:UTP-monosaccharide-1-phosphate uridylyltransferase n=1 Tax=Cryptosporidium canis TaxID=195482 RepID=A0ABQ8PEV5_9CRYT|nr:secreted UDP-N-acetylglucosamine pyrophosphorylase-like protein [Cryptosporidium canis]
MASKRSSLVLFFLSLIYFFAFYISMVVTVSLRAPSGSGETLDLDKLKENLSKAGQDHILALINSGDSENVNRLVSQLMTLEASCVGGGILGYINRAKKLLKDSKDGVNPREGCYPEVPEVVNLEVGSDDFKMYEDYGFSTLKNVAFVLVAGGLGERLAFEGIKIGIELSMASKITFFQLYTSYIKEYQRRVKEASGENVLIPLIIMTSDDTDSMTRKFLEDNQHFGLSEDQVYIVKQLKVPALEDSNAKIALDPEDNYTILTKPHGHGDIHTLLHASGLLSDLSKEGVRYLIFIQDTNALVFNSVLPVLGVTAKESFVMNSLTIPRIPCEAVGALCKLRYPDGRKITINTEYNQLTPLLKSCGLGSDFADEKTGYSPFPGNSNVLFISMDAYLRTLEKTGGVVPEFVNPKYADSTKSAFKSPTRLECMMQDIPLLFEDGYKVGCVQMQRWATFSACKNSLAEGRAKHNAGVSIDTASITEGDFYAAAAQYFRLACSEKGVVCRIEESGKDPVTGKEDKNSLIKHEMISGIPVRVGAMIVLHPSFAIKYSDILDRIQGGPIIITSRSYVHIEGDVVISGKLFVDGSLKLIAKNGSRIVIKSLVVNNAGTTRYHISEQDMAHATSNQKIRGYGIRHEQVREIVASDGQEVIVNDEN